MINIKSLSATSIESIHQAFVIAFADYEEPFDMTVKQLQYMIERRGFVPELSFGAFDDEELIGFILNGIGLWNNILTAYDTGTGIVKAYRKQGIATRIFNESLPVLKQHGVNQYLLEVIKTNTKAYELYKKAGFEVLREFDYFVSPIESINTTTEELITGFSINEIDEPQWDLFSTFRDFTPSWQNSSDSIQRKRSFFKILGIFNEKTLVGYGIIETHTGDIPQFAIAKNFRRKGLGTALFKTFCNTTESGIIKIINTDFKDKGTKIFIESLGFKAGFGQYEMLHKF
ncbi:MAG: GNAT family N-acetyltransferase [Bacteroidetes bacterium]|nr:GNAT family N-acetyltransferase [Bacteroidota bacterium]